MSPDHFEADYLIETPLAPGAVAATMAGEQSCGTFTRVSGETDALRLRARAEVVSVESLGQVSPSLPSAWLSRKGLNGPVERAKIRLRFPVANVGANLPTLVATVAGNLFDLGETTGLRLERITLSPEYRAQFPLPQVGVAGTRSAAGVETGAMIGTIIKPNVGMTAQDTADIVRTLCEAGVDFIKDDEICADPVHAPLAQRVPAVMKVIRDHRERTGKNVMVGFNISDETSAMQRHLDLIQAEGGSCAMFSMNWCGFSAAQTLRKSTDMALHAHRNGYGAVSRHPALGIGIEAYQALWRLSGVDHFHVHGLQGKFAQKDEEVVVGAQACLTPMANTDDRVLPAFSNGQWAGTVPLTYQATGTADLLFMAGGGILAHPDGGAAGVQSLRDAWQAVLEGVDVNTARKNSAALDRAYDFFGPRT
ncbi:MAG: RuBisCO large subunit C-terminal-like domain-containing protein [Marinosulfonomonas sp.]